MNRFAVRQRGDALDYAVNDGLLYVGIFDAISHGLRRLARRRSPYVARRPNPRDRCSRLVFLTERGASVKPLTHATASRVGRSAGQS